MEDRVVNVRQDEQIKTLYNRVEKLEKLVDGLIPSIDKVDIILNDMGHIAKSLNSVVSELRELKMEHRDILIDMQKDKLLIEKERNEIVSKIKIAIATAITTIIIQTISASIIKSIGG